MIALKTRSVAAHDPVSQSLTACRCLVANGAEQIVFKYCSTFDSTPEGNIGPFPSTVACSTMDTSPRRSWRKRQTWCS
ncbi:four-carbon acid sugar kinase family protein [Mesorhizobium helmanticense]|uniref:four-carbon acid sugar kinase family protein n=1 Tax=Mesorhizobium helmanticense TaxID=1776423 RepID=UPI003159D6AB